MTNMTKITMMDGRTFKVGMRVRLWRDGNNEGEITAIKAPKRGIVTFLVDCGPPTTKRQVRVAACQVGRIIDP